MTGYYMVSHLVTVAAQLCGTLTPSPEEGYCSYAEVILQIGGRHTDEGSMDINESLSDIELGL